MALGRWEEKWKPLPYLLSPPSSSPVCIKPPFTLVGFVAWPCRDVTNFRSCTPPSPPPTPPPPSREGTLAFLPLKWSLWNETERLTKRRGKRGRERRFFAFWAKSYRLSLPPLAFLFYIKFKNQWWRFDKKEEETRGGGEGREIGGEFLREIFSNIRKRRDRRIRILGKFGKNGRVEGFNSIL